MAAGRHVGLTLSRVTLSLNHRTTRFRSVNQPCRTGQLARHIGCSLRVVHRVNCYSKMRGCDHCFSRHRPNSHPFYLLSCFPGSFLLVISRDRIAIPRVHTVCNNSFSHGDGLIRCKFHLGTTLSGEPLGFSRFRRLIGGTVCMDTAPTSCRLTGSRNIVMRRIVHPANLLSPRVRIHPSGDRVSSLVRRVSRQTRHSRHILIAALAGHVTRRLGGCVRHGKIHYTCVRSSVSAFRHIRVLSKLHAKLFSILVNIGLLHRNLSLPRMSLITIVSTSGRKFLHSRHSLARATNHTTHGIGNGMVVCTSHVAGSVRVAVSRAGHHHRGRLGCGTSRGVAPAPVTDHASSTLDNVNANGDHKRRGRDIVTTAGTAGASVTPGPCVRPRRLSITTSPMMGCVAHSSLSGTVGGTHHHVRRTTGGLSFVRTTR